RRHTRFSRDWSSDVCSSDLAADTRAGAEAAPVQELGIREQRCFDRLRQLPAGVTLGFSAGRGGFLHARVKAQLDDPPRLLLDSEIGRASCRERVQISEAGGA